MGTDMDVFSIPSVLPESLETTRLHGKSSHDSRQNPYTDTPQQQPFANKHQDREIMMKQSRKSVDNSFSTPASSSPATASSLASHPAWKAFLAGMQALQRYANRSPVNVQAVAESNMRLLHRSLRVDKHYRMALEKLREENTPGAVPALQHLHSDQGLSADLIALQNGASIKLSALPQSYTMYLLISGTAQLDPRDVDTTTAKARANQAWWQRLFGGGSKNTLRSGNAIIRFSGHGPIRLTGLDKACLLLRVRTAVVEVAYRIAS